MPTAEVTPARVKSALKVALAVSAAIREAREIPSGTLYAMLMERVGIDLEGYESLVRTLVNTGLVANRNHMLVWIGP